MQYEEWIQNPGPYGGIDTLEKIKEAKENGSKFLDFSYYTISDIEPLNGLKNVEELFLNSHQIEDLTPLSGLTNLRILEIANNKITNVSALENLFQLEYLDISGNAITDVGPLGKLTKLSSLGVDTNITDLSPLFDNDNLTLWIEPDSEFTSVSSLSDFVKLKELHVFGNVRKSHQDLLNSSLTVTYINWDSSKIYNDLLCADFPYTIEFTKDDINWLGWTQKSHQQITFEEFPIGSRLCHHGASSVVINSSTLRKTTTIYTGSVPVGEIFG